MTRGATTRAAHAGRAATARRGIAGSDDLRALLRAYERTGDAVARERLIERLMPLVRSLARRYANCGERLEDLVQVGSIGLIEAIDRFDSGRGDDLVRFAIPTITGEIRHHLRDRVSVVRVPRRLMESTSAPQSRQSQVPVRVGTSDDDEPRLERAMAVEGPYESSDDRLLLAAGFRALAGRERRILHLRFFAGLSQDEIAREVGLSQVQVSRLIRASLERMRGALDVDRRHAASAPSVRTP